MASSCTMGVLLLAGMLSAGADQRGYFPQKGGPQELRSTVDKWPPHLASEVQHDLVPSETISLVSGVLSSGLWSLAPLISSLGLKLVIKLAVGGVAVVGLILLVSAFTVALCTFTPLCDTAFYGVEDSESGRSFISSDSLSSATRLLSRAISKYTPNQPSSKDN